MRVEQVAQDEVCECMCEWSRLLRMRCVSVCVRVRVEQVAQDEVCEHV